LDAKAIEQYAHIAERKGVRFAYDDSLLTELWKGLHEENPRISEFQSNDGYDPPRRSESGERGNGIGEAGERGKTKG